MQLDAIPPNSLIGSADGSTLVTMRYQMDPIRSLDAGLTWTSFNINGQRPRDGFAGVQIAPSNAMTWYATGDADHALYLSTDGGRSWGKRNDAAASYLGRGVLISADPQVIYQAKYEVDPACDFNECPVTKSTLQVSNDGGVRWRDLRSAQGFLSAYPSPVDSTLVFAVETGGLNRSRDGGTSWTPITLPGLPSSASFGRFAFDRFDVGLVYFVPISGDQTRIFASRDAGTTWTSAAAQGGQLIADPAQTGRAFLFTNFGGAYETRDAGATWVHVEPAINTSINSYVGGVVFRNGRRFAVNIWDSTLRLLDLNDGALALSSDLWWNPQQSGWGISITHHSSTQTFVGWYAYDRNGNSVWRVIPGGQWSDRVFKGDVYQTTGPPYFGVAFDPSQVVTRRVGKAQIAFDDEDNAAFSWQLDEGLSGNQRVVREKFGVPISQQVVYDNFADLWWNAAESGWGVAINHQYDNVFAAWYTYDSAGHPFWIVMPDAKMRLEGALPKATGTLYTTHGPSSAAPPHHSPALLKAFESMGLFRV